MQEFLALSSHCAPQLPRTSLLSSSFSCVIHPLAWTVLLAWCILPQLSSSTLRVNLAEPRITWKGSLSCEFTLTRLIFKYGYKAVRKQLPNQYLDSWLGKQHKIAHYGNRTVVNCKCTECTLKVQNDHKCGQQWSNSTSRNVIWMHARP